MVEIRGAAEEVTPATSISTTITIAIAIATSAIGFTVAITVVAAVRFARRRSQGIVTNVIVTSSGIIMALEMIGTGVD